MELLLCLVKNILAIPDPPPAMCSGNFHRTMLHDELVVLMQKTNLLELLLVLAENISQEEFEGYTFLLVEILCWLLRKDTPLGLMQTWYQNHEKRSGNSRGSLGGLLDAERSKRRASNMNLSNQKGSRRALKVLNLLPTPCSVGGREPLCVKVMAPARLLVRWIRRV